MSLRIVRSACRVSTRTWRDFTNSHADKNSQHSAAIIFAIFSLILSFSYMPSFTYDWPFVHNGHKQKQKQKMKYKNTKIHSWKNFNCIFLKELNYGGILLIAHLSMFYLVFFLFIFISIVSNCFMMFRSLIVRSFKSKIPIFVTLQRSNETHIFFLLQKNNIGIKATAKSGKRSKLAAGI